MLLSHLHLTGEEKYTDAAKAYSGDYFKCAQHPSARSGLRAWGEHLAYHVFRDEVAAGRKYHEFLEHTSPWDRLWEVNPEATERAIEGVKLHFYGPDTKDFLHPLRPPRPPR